MPTLTELRKIRLKKLEAVKKSGITAYPARTGRTHKIAEALDGFLALAKAKKEVVLAGRIRSLREHGGSSFCHIEDGTSRIQAFFRKNKIGPRGYKFFLDNFDVGDFIEVRGILFKTKRGEKTIEPSNFKMLAKSLLPLPEKWHGLKDEEERFRKRYLDLLFNKEVREKFELRDRIVKLLREFLDQKGFLEVETPVLQDIYSGADARPFKTHINAFDLPAYLRISLELPLKRLIVAGFEKVYELGRVFRNEGVDRQHNPDFTMLEFYWAYEDYRDMMRLTEEMLASLVKKLFGKTKIKYEGKEIDFKAPWPKVEYGNLVRKYTKLDIDTLNRASLLKEAKKLGLSPEDNWSKGKVVDEIYKKYCRPRVWEPTFVIHHPADMKPLAKQSGKNPLQAESFQLLLGGGWELVNAWSEQNDPLAQLKAFKEQESLFRKGLEEAQRMDMEFVEALEYGMPPTAGFGMGIDRLVALLTDSHSLREVILFPTMKPR